MKIVIAPDSYKESLTALEVAEAIEQGFRKVLPDASYHKVPMADGGEGTVQSLVDATNGAIVKVDVTGPTGKAVQGFFGVTGDKTTAIIEVAAAVGLHLVSDKERDPYVATSYGVGELIRSALDLGIQRIILGLGGSATNDGGAGMLQALGAKLQDASQQELGFGGGNLSKLASLDFSALDQRLSEVKIDVACDVDNLLCGESGATFVFGRQKGASPDLLLPLDEALSHYGNKLEKHFNKPIKNVPGVGAAGGIAAALYGVLGANLRSGIEIVIDASGLAKTLEDADLVITGEGRIDSQTIYGKTPIGVAKLAKIFSLPVIGIAGSISHDCEVVNEHGIDMLFSVVNGACSLSEAFKDAAKNVELTSRNVAKAITLSC